jgi:hypothetical protein
MREDAVLTSSRLHSSTLSIGASNAEPTSLCPHCRPLLIFFLYSFAYIYILTMCSHTRTNGDEREKERESRETEKKAS